MTSTLWIGSPSVEASIDPDLSITPPETVLHPVMVQRWECVSFVHWPCRPHDVQRHLPPGIEVDTFDGAAWVGLVPFHLTVRPGMIDASKAMFNSIAFTNAVKDVLKGILVVLKIGELNAIES